MFASEAGELSGLGADPECIFEATLGSRDYCGAYEVVRPALDVFRILVRCEPGDHLRRTVDLSPRDVDLGQRAQEALRYSLEQPLLRHLSEGGKCLVPAPEHEEGVAHLAEQAPSPRPIS